MNVGGSIAIDGREASKGLTEKVTFKLRLEAARKRALCVCVGGGSGERAFRQRQQHVQRP